MSKADKCVYCDGTNLMTFPVERVAIYINKFNKLKVLIDNRDYSKEINYCPMCRQKVR